MKDVLVFFILCLTIVSLLLIGKCDNDNPDYKMTYEQFEEYLQENEGFNNGQLKLSHYEVNLLLERLDWQTVPDTVIEEIQKSIFQDLPREIDIH